MKALLIKDIYNIRFSFMLLLAVYIIGQLVLMYVGFSLSVYLHGFLTFTMFLLVFQETISSDDKVKWNSLLLSFPISRQTIVNEKFVFLGIVTLFIFGLHIGLLNFSLSINNEIIFSEVWGAMIIEATLLIFLCCFGVLSAVSGLLSNRKHDCIVPNLIIMFIFMVMCLIINLILTPENYSRVVLPSMIIGFYGIVFLSILPGYILALIFCKVRIGKREY